MNIDLEGLRRIFIFDFLNNELHVGNEIGLWIGEKEIII